MKMPPFSLALPAPAANRLFTSPQWWLLPTLRTLVPHASTILAYDFGPGRTSPLYAFLAADEPPNRRCFVLLHDIGLITFDIAPAESIWSLDPPDPSLHRVELPCPTAHRDERQRWHLNLLSPAPLAVTPLIKADLAGAKVERRVVLFHTEPYLAQSALHFDFTGEGTFQILLAGLAPGAWDIWRDGFLEDTPATVRPAAATLWREGPAGSYFVTRRG